MKISPHLFAGEFFLSYICRRNLKTITMTAEEFIENQYSDTPYELEDIVDLMIEFAKYHVQQALKEASEEAELHLIGESDAGSEYDGIDKDSILNAYPDSNIK